VIQPSPTFPAEALRADFPILGRTVHGGPLVYFDNAATSQRPRQVIEAVVEAYERHYANVARGIHTLAQESDELYEAAREKVRAMLNAARGARDPDNPATSEEIIFTPGATGAINLVARSWADANLRPGDEILLTEMEHHANLVPWYQAAERTGAVVRHVPITDDGRLELAALDRLLGERTRLLAVTAVSNVLGTVNPVGQIIRRAHEAGAKVLVDGAQSVPHMATDVAALDCDFLVFSGHKMLGPSGVGVLFAKRELLDAMPPFLGGGNMISEVTLDGFRPNRLPNKFEAGTPPIVPAIGLGAAIDYLGRVGLAAIHEHEQRLVRRAHEVLASVEGVRIVGPAPEQKAGIVSFTVERVHAHDLAELLDRRGIAIRAGHHCAMPLHKRLGVAATARASFYLYNTLDEVDRLGEAIEQAKRVFARHRSRRR
jgi:cysteine desulfurase/selenocysteine lyase